MALFFHACAPEAPNVEFGATIVPVPGLLPGTEFLQVESIYPNAPLPATDRFPVDTDVVIMFSKPVNMADITAANIDIPGAPAFGVPSSFAGGKGVRIPFAINFAFGSTYTITVDPTAIRDSGGDFGIAGPNDTGEFTTSMDTIADYDPVVIAATRYPVGAGPFSRDQDYVVVSFNKEVQNVTAATFAIAPVAASGAPYSTPDQKTWYLPLNVLTYGQIYTVVLDDIPPGIRDLGLRELVPGPNNTWTFTVEANPSPGGPITIGSHWITNLSENSATINWITNLPFSGASIDWGFTQAYGNNTPEAAGTRTVHSVTVALPAVGSKYYYRINSGAAVPPTGNFISQYGLTPAANPGSPVKDNAGDNTGLRVLQNSDGSSVLTWTNGTNVYASRFSTAGVFSWAADGNVVYANGSNARIFDDTAGSAIITYENGGNLYAKKINNGGAFGFYGNGWGSAVGDAGVNLGAGSKLGAAAVTKTVVDNNITGGFFTRADSGTTTMNIPANAFYDFTAATDFLAVALSNGDIVMDPNNHDGTTVTRSTNFRHVLGQAAAVIASGDTYVIGDASNTVNITATDHEIRDTNPDALVTDYVSGADLIYTAHGWIAPTSPVWLSANDIVASAGSYGRINALNLVSPIALIDSGNADGDGTGLLQLLDSTKQWLTLSIASDTDRVLKTSPPLVLTTIAAGGVADFVLTLNADPPFAIGDAYEIYDRYCNDHSLATDQFQDFYEFTVNWNIGITSGTAFDIYDFDTINMTGTAEAPPGNPLYDDAADFLSVVAPLPVLVNDVVINTTDYAGPPHPNLAKVTTAPFTVKTRALGLDTSIMANGEEYWILRLVDHTVAADIIESGSSDGAGNPLISSNASFIVAGVKTGDMVYNITQDRYAVVTANPTIATQLALNKNIFTGAGEEFIVISSDQVLLETGTVTTAGNPFTDANADFTGVSIGDIVRNQTTGVNATVTAKTLTTLTLNPAIAMNVGNRYIVVPQDRVLFAWQSGNDIVGALVRQTAGTVVSALSICTSGALEQNPWVIPDGTGNAFVVYQSGASIRAKLLGPDGNFIVGGPVGDQGVNVGGGTILYIQSDQNNGFYILYDDGANVMLRRFNNTITSVWSQAITASGFEAAFIVDPATGRPFVVYDNGTGIVTVQARDVVTGVAAFTTAVMTVASFEPNPLPASSAEFHLSIASDNNGGALISWIDSRYYIEMGICVFVQAINNLGTRQWDADTGPGFDLEGILYGVLNSWDDNDGVVKTVFYNDGGPPWGGLFLWYDYRNNRSDIYFQTRTNP
jgi:hypothetical protein